MNRREFLAVGSLGAVGVTILTPIASYAKIYADLNPISLQEATTTPSWLRRFDGARTSTLLSKRRFRLLIEGAFAGLSAPFWFNCSIHNTMGAFMSRPDYVTVHHNRYIVVKGTMAHFAANRAMLWVDSRYDPTASIAPRAVLSVVDVGDGENSPQLWIIDNHFSLAGGEPEVPHNLRLCMSRWILSRKPFRWEGALLQRVSRLLASAQSGPQTPKAYGIPEYRCAVL